MRNSLKLNDTCILGFPFSVLSLQRHKGSLGASYVAELTLNVFRPGGLSAFTLSSAQQTQEILPLTHNQMIPEGIIN